MFHTTMFHTSEKMKNGILVQKCISASINLEADVALQYIIHKIGEFDNADQTTIKYDQPSSKFMMLYDYQFLVVDVILGIIRIQPSKDNLKLFSAALEDPLSLDMIVDKIRNIFKARHI